MALIANNTVKSNPVSAPTQRQDLANNVTTTANTVPKFSYKHDMMTVRKL